MTRIFGSENPDQFNVDDFITDAQEPDDDDDDDDDIWLDFSKDPPLDTSLDGENADVVLEECWPN